MADVAHSLARRALEVTQQHVNNVDSPEDHPLKQIALWGFLLLWVTMILYMAVVSAVSRPPSLCLSVY